MSGFSGNFLRRTGGVMTGDIILDNSRFIKGKDVPGNVKILLGIGGDNWGALGEDSILEWRIRGGGGFFLKSDVQTRAVTSSEFTIATATGGSFAHGFGAVPSLCAAVLRCKTAEGNFAVGDEEALAYITELNVANERGFALFADATNVGFMMNSTSNPRLFNKTTGAPFDITAANWRVVLRAWK